MREFSKESKWVELELVAAAQIVVRTDKLNPAHQRVVAAHRVPDRRRAYREIPSLGLAPDCLRVDVTPIVDDDPPLGAAQHERHLHVANVSREDALQASRGRGNRNTRFPLHG
jgi:hypothetical protein